MSITTMGTAAKRRSYRERLYDQQSGMCHWCGKRMSLNRKKTGQPARDFATFEHLIRRVEGGSMGPDNIILAHRVCNYHREIARQAGEFYERHDRQ